LHPVRDDANVVVQERHGNRLISNMRRSRSIADRAQEGDDQCRRTIASRVEDLEKRVTRLEELPTRIDDLTLQISQLRTEMRGEFSAVRAEMAERETNVTTQMRMLHEDVIGRIALLHEATTAKQGRRSRKTKR